MKMGCWCWKCWKEVPLLDEDEYVQVDCAPKAT
jgi:hypothetical protein